MAATAKNVIASLILRLIDMDWTKAKGNSCA